MRARSVNVEERIMEALRNNPSISITRLSLQFNISRHRIWSIIHAEGFHPFHYTPVQGLLPEDLGKRLEFCNWLLERQFASNNFITNIFWTDESQFTRDGITNFHNLHVWAESNPHPKKETSFQHRFSVNLWAGVLGNRLIGPFRLPERINSETYLQFLRSDLPELLEDVSLMQRTTMWYQQDGAPPHYGREIKNYLDSKYPNRWIGRNGPTHWPARSPDLTVMDFFVWGRMKELVYSTEITSLEDLNDRIDGAATKLREELQHFNVERHIQKRALACIQSGGSHFEHLL